VAKANAAKEPRIQISLTFAEILSLLGVCWLGKMFSRPDDRENVSAIFSRIQKALVRLGCPKEDVDKISLGR
jgi:hypothetical protein